MLEFLRAMNFFGAVFTLLLSLGQLVIKQKQAKHWAFAGLYFCIFILNMANVNAQENLEYMVPGLALVDIPFLYAAGPLLYIIMCEVRQVKSRLKYRFHFLLPVAALAASMPYYLNTEIDKSQHLLNAFGGNQLLFNDVLYIGGLFTTFVYIMITIVSVASVWRLQVIKNEVAVQQISIIIVASLVILIFAFVALFTRNHLFFRISSVMITLVVCLIFIMGHRNPNLYQSFITAVNQSKYKKSHLEGLDLNMLENELEQLMTSEKLYQQEDLSLSKLSAHLNIGLHQLSEYLNKHKSQSFTQYVHGFRVAEAKSLLASGENDTILTIAYKVGFNSVSSFNRAFSKFEGMSPKQYQMKHRK